MASRITDCSVFVPDGKAKHTTSKDRPRGLACNGARTGSRAWLWKERPKRVAENRTRADWVCHDARAFVSKWGGCLPFSIRRGGTRLLRAVSDAATGRWYY